MDLRERQVGQLTLSPDVEVKGDVRFDPQSVLLGHLEDAALLPSVVLEQLAVQEAGSSSRDKGRLDSLKCPADCL